MTSPLSDLTALELVDVGPRDGLQNAVLAMSVPDRARLISGLLAAGLSRVEAVSFVHPKRVPQMAGAEEVVRELTEIERQRCCALVLNERGYDRFRAAAVGSVRIALAVSEAFQQRNAGMSLAGGLRQAKAVLRRAADDGTHAGVVLATSFGCPFSGDVSVQSTIGTATELVDAGAQEIVFADTIGVAVPRQVRELFRAASGLKARLGIHTHNTRYACTLTAVEHGAAIVDASVGGLGGCPFAPNAGGNIATEDVVYVLEREGLSVGVNASAVLELGRWLHELGFELESAQQRVAA